MTRQEAIKKQNESFAIYFDGQVIEIDGKIVRAAKRDGVVTVARCKELVEFARSNGFDPKKLKIDMVEWDYENIDDETYASVLVGDCGISKRQDKIAYYDIAGNCLQIWSKGYPVYENNNGTICRDEVALADCLM